MPSGRRESRAVHRGDGSLLLHTRYRAAALRDTGRDGWHQQIGRHCNFYEIDDMLSIKLLLVGAPILPVPPTTSFGNGSSCGVHWSMQFTSFRVIQEPRIAPCAHCTVPRRIPVSVCFQNSRAADYRFALESQLIAAVAGSTAMDMQQIVIERDEPLFVHVARNKRVRNPAQFIGIEGAIVQQ